MKSAISLQIENIKNIKQEKQKHKNKNSKTDLEAVFLEILSKLQAVVNNKSDKLENRSKIKIDLTKFIDKSLNKEDLSISKAKHKLKLNLNDILKNENLAKEKNINLKKLLINAQFKPENRSKIKIDLTKFIDKSLNKEDLSINKTKHKLKLDLNLLDFTKNEKKNINNISYDYLKAEKKENPQLDFSKFAININKDKKIKFLIPLPENEKLSISIDKINKSVHIKIFTENNINLLSANFNNLAKTLNSIGFNNIAFSQYISSQNNNQDEQRNNQTFKTSAKSKKINLNESSFNLENEYQNINTAINIIV